MESMSRLRLIFGRAQNPRRRSFHYQDIGLNWTSIVLMQFFTQLVFLDRAGANIANMFCKMWESWGITESRRQLLVRDGAANMCVGGELAEIDSIHCTVHRLQLVIEDAILSKRAITDLLAKCRRLATHFNHSALASCL